jgi:valyl-tRNA synthetase
MATYVMMDMFARFHRMIGDEVLFPLGLDRNGLPIEIAAERKFKCRCGEVSRERFLEMCKEVLDECSSSTMDSYLRNGIGFNSWEIGEGIGDAYFTDLPTYRRLTQETFIDLWKKGLIYEDERINNFCPGCRTTIADAEVVYEDRQTSFYEIKFKLKETSEDLIIATTRPELACTCARLVFHPDDARYARLKGMYAITPVFEKEVEIISHTMADPEKGTGLMMMCSMGDLTDIRFFRELGIKPVIAISVEGRMNSNAGFLEGKTPAQARKAMVEAMTQKGLVVSKKDVMHRTPICDRSKDPIEFIAMKEFYLKQVEFKDKIREIAHRLNFYAPESRQILLDWIDAVSTDWPISRRRFYATEIPLWYCSSCNAPFLPPKGRYYQPWRETPPIEACPKCGGKEFRGEERVFDTWFDSSISPLYIMKYGRDNAFFERARPCTLRPQGKEIVRTWLYYTLLKDYLLTGECIFRDIWINQHYVAEGGKKMSKSKGNVVDPTEVLEQFGAEPFRLWCSVEGDITKGDLRCSFDRISGAAKSITKLWNVARFISGFKEAPEPKQLLPLDQWIINECSQIEALAKEGYARYDFHNPVVRVRTFLWDTFASHYIELAKARAYNDAQEFTQEERESALFALHHVLRSILKMLAPVTPLITYEIYRILYGKDVHAEPFPDGSRRFEVGFTTQDIETLNSAVWKAKKDRGVPMRSEVAELALPEKLSSIQREIRNLHKVKAIKFGNEISVTLGPSAQSP